MHAGRGVNGGGGVGLGGCVVGLEESRAGGWVCLAVVVVELVVAEMVGAIWQH